MQPTQTAPCPPKTSVLPTIPTWPPGVRLIDCFLYNGEPVTALRLATVYPHVDEIVVVESRETFTGLTKPRLYIETCVAIFAPYLDKVTFLVVDFPAEVRGNAWECEHYQRNFPADHIRRRWEGRPYIVLACDVDEIPSPPVLIGIRGLYGELDMPVYLVMRMLYYNFDWYKDCNPWARAFAVNDRCVTRAAFSFEWGRTVLRRERFLPNAGHHLSYFMTVDDIRRKINSFSHTEVNTPQVNNDEWLRQCIEKGQDIVGRDKTKDRKRLVPTPPVIREGFPVGWETLQAQLVQGCLTKTSSA